MLLVGNIKVKFNFLWNVPNYKSAKESCWAAEG